MHLCYPQIRRTFKSSLTLQVGGNAPRGCATQVQAGEAIMTLNEALQGLGFRSLRSIFLFVFGCCLLMPGTVHAQAQAAIKGTVRDTSGAIIPDASVVLHNSGTNLDRPATTNSVGAYVLTDIQPGNYDLRVSKDGFTTAVQSDITLLVNQTATYDFTLKPGSVKETVTVQAT